MRNPATPQFSELANTASQHANRITLSILVPFYRDDPTALAAALNPLIGGAQPARPPGARPLAALSRRRYGPGQ